MFGCIGSDPQQLAEISDLKVQNNVLRKIDRLIEAHWMRSSEKTTFSMNLSGGMEVAVAANTSGVGSTTPSFSPARGPIGPLILMTFVFPTSGLMGKCGLMGQSEMSAACCPTMSGSTMQ